MSQDPRLYHAVHELAGLVHRVISNLHDAGAAPQDSYHSLRDQSTRCLQQLQAIGTDPSTEGAGTDPAQGSGEGGDSEE